MTLHHTAVVTCSSPPGVQPVGTPAVLGPCTASTQPPAALSLPSHPYRLHSLQDGKQPGSPCAVGQGCARHPQTARPGSRSPAAKEKGRRTAERCRNSAVICRGSDQPPPRARGQPARRRMDLEGLGSHGTCCPQPHRLFLAVPCSKHPGRTPTLHCRHGPPSSRNVKGKGACCNSARLELSLVQNSKARQKRQDKTGPVRRVSEGKVRKAAGRAELRTRTVHPHCAPASPPQRRDRHSGRGLFAKQSGGSPRDRRFEMEQTQLHPRVYLTARSFNQPESGAKPRDSCLEHQERFKKLCFTSAAEIKGADRSKVRKAGARQASSFG